MTPETPEKLEHTEHTARNDPSERAGVDPMAQLEAYVGDWLTVDEVAARLGVAGRVVERLIHDGELVAFRTAPRTRLVPAAFVSGGAVVRGLAGTLTLLSDAGYDDIEAVRWLFTRDDGLGDTPMACLIADRIKPVRRLAQTLGF